MTRLGPYRLVAKIACLVPALGMSIMGEAQQREFYNGGFEQNDPKGPGTPTFEIFANALVPEWTDQTGVIELWDSGFQGVAAYEGNVFAEMNAKSAGTLYQEVCLIAGESLGWTFAHRARSGGGPNPQTANFEIADSAGTVVQALTSQTSFKGDPWSVNTGSTTFSGTTGVYRIQFRAATASSYGNFVDALQLDIAAFAQFGAPFSADAEAGGGNLPTIIVDGRVKTTTTLPVTVTGGSADGSDFALTSGVVTIPPGLYRSTPFPLPLDVADDFLDEPDETVTFQLGTPSTSDVVFARTVCDGSAPQTATLYTIENDDTVLTGVKTVVIVDNGIGNDYAVPGNEAVYTITVSNAGSEAVDAETLFLSDSLPREVALYTGDYDGVGPITGPVAFTETASNLNWVVSDDLGYSDQIAKPQAMTDCTYIPVELYDPAIRHICFAPSGTFASADSDPVFAVTFRTKIL